MTRALFVLAVLLSPARLVDIRPSLVRTRPCSAQDSLGLLKPSDAGFADAHQFRRFLTGQGFVVHCVIRSKFQSFIWDWPEAAFLTDRGDLEVRFFPTPNGAAQLRVDEARIGSGWRYSFPGHARPRDTLYAVTRQYFVRVGRWLVLVTDPSVAAVLRRALPTLAGRETPRS